MVLRPRRGRRPALGARFGVFLPQTSFEDTRLRPLGLGPNTLRAFVEALATQPVGRGRLLANAGLLLFDRVLDLHDQSDFLAYGLALEWPLGSRLTAVAEMAGRAGQGSPGADQSSEARAGLRYGRGRVRFDAAVRRGLLATDGTWGVTAGLAWTARARRAERSCRRLDGGRARTRARLRRRSQRRGAISDSSSGVSGIGLPLMLLATRAFATRAGSVGGQAVAGEARDVQRARQRFDPGDSVGGRRGGAAGHDRGELA